MKKLLTITSYTKQEQISYNYIVLYILYMRAVWCSVYSEP